IATIASIALPPSARIARPASTAPSCGAQTTPRRCPAVWRSIKASRLGCRWRKPALAQQRVRARQPPAERPVGLGRVAPAAARLDVVVQLAGRGLVEYVAGFPERLERVGVEH